MVEVSSSLSSHSLALGTTRRQTRLVAKHKRHCLYELLPVYFPCVLVLSISLEGKVTVVIFGGAVFTFPSGQYIDDEASVIRSV